MPVFWLFSGLGTRVLKFTFIGLTLSSSWGNGHATPYRAILRALTRLGHACVFYERDVDYYRKRRDLAECDYCDLVLYQDWDAIGSQMLADAAASDVIIVGSYCSEGVLICDDVLSLAGPLRVFYDLDTPVTLAALSSGDLEYLRRDQMAGFDLYLSFTGGEILRRLEHDYGVRMARPVYGCVDPDAHSRVAPRPEFQCALSYMGTYAADRQQKLDELFLTPAQLLPSQPFILAGSLYPANWPWPPNLRRFEHVPPADHPALYSSSHATLNLTRDGMARSGWCPSGRFFEAAACGTPILTDSFHGLDEFFTPGEEVLVVNTAEEVVKALMRDEDSLRHLAERARQRTLREHTGMNRAQDILRYCEEARNRCALSVPRWATWNGERGTENAA
jgi:spore maturation protein CgeB